MGVKLTLAFGGIGYCIYAISLLVSVHASVGGFNIFAGALLGVCAGLLWTAQGTIMISYPPEAEKGRYFAWFWAIFNLGAVIGSLVSFQFLTPPRISDTVLLYPYFIFEHLPTISRFPWPRTSTSQPTRLSQMGLTSPSSCSCSLELVLLFCFATLQTSSDQTERTLSSRSTLPGNPSSSVSGKRSNSSHTSFSCSPCSGLPTGSTHTNRTPSTALTSTPAPRPSTLSCTISLRSPVRCSWDMVSIARISGARCALDSHWASSS